MGRNLWKYLGLFTQMALSIVISVAISTLIGIYLDRVFAKTAVFTLLFIFIGVASGLWVAYQILMKMSLDDLDK